MGILLGLLTLENHDLSNSVGLLPLKDTSETSGKVEMGTQAEVHICGGDNVGVLNSAGGKENYYIFQIVLHVSEFEYR